MADGYIDIPDWHRGRDQVPLDRELAIKWLKQITEFLEAEFKEEEENKNNGQYGW